MSVPGRSGPKLFSPNSIYFASYSTSSLWRSSHGPPAPRARPIAPQRPGGRSWPDRPAVRIFLPQILRVDLSKLVAQEDRILPPRLEVRQRWKIEFTLVLAHHGLGASDRGRKQRD